MGSPGGASVLSRALDLLATLTTSGAAELASFLWPHPPLPLLCLTLGVLGLHLLSPDAPGAPLRAEIDFVPEPFRLSSVPRWLCRTSFAAERALRSGPRREADPLGSSQVSISSTNLDSHNFCIPVTFALTSCYHPRSLPHASSRTYL
ncbi:hypothetical protein C8R44DRAFT_405880 [Mycena epipterygia]|nr:hypothetical protein C8R44DRAFT_405880 [Mycena epipterygia]